MSVQINNQYVDERYSPILEPNLYYGSVFVPGVTCTDKYILDSSGNIYIHKLKTSAVEVGKPGRDFNDVETSDDLLQIQFNNNFQKSRKIYGIQASEVGIDLANENLGAAIAECSEGWQLSAAACLVQESTASTVTTAITLDELKADLIARRGEIVKKKGSADIILCSPDYYGKVLEYAGKDFSPSTNDKIVQSGNVGVWLGFTFVEFNGLAATEAKYYDSSNTLKTVKFAGATNPISYVMYNHNALSAITNFVTARLRDSENFVGTKAQVEMNAGFKFTNPALGVVRAEAAVTPTT